MRNLVCRKALLLGPRFSEFVNQFCLHSAGFGGQDGRKTRDGDDGHFKSMAAWSFRNLP